MIINNKIEIIKEYQIYINYILNNKLYMYMYYIFIINDKKQK